MSVLLIILGFAALIAVYYGITSLTSRATAAASRAVFSKSHDAGRKEMGKTLTFKAPVSTVFVTEAIVQRVNAHEAAPPVAGGLYLAQRNENLIVFAVGNKFSTVFRARIDVQSDGYGSRGTLKVIDWRENGAAVGGKEAVKLLIERTSAAVTDLGGTAIESQNSGPIG